MPWKPTPVTVPDIPETRVIIPEVQVPAGCSALQHQPICLVWDLPCEASCSAALLWLAWHVSRLWLTCCGHGPV